MINWWVSSDDSAVDSSGFCLRIEDSPRCLIRACDVSVYCTWARHGECEALKKWIGVSQSGLIKAADGLVVAYKHSYTSSP